MTTNIKRENYKLSLLQDNVNVRARVCVGWFVRPARTWYEGDPVCLCIIFPFLTDVQHLPLPPSYTTYLETWSHIIDGWSRSVARSAIRQSLLSFNFFFFILLLAHCYTASRGSLFFSVRFLLLMEYVVTCLLTCVGGGEKWEMNIWTGTRRRLDYYLAKVDWSKNWFGHVSCIVGHSKCVTIWWW